MQTRPLPPEIKALMVQIDALIKNPELNRDHFSDLKKFGLSQLISTQTYNGVSHSCAGWIHHAGRQDILDWLYEHCNTDPEANFFLLHWAVVCRQPEANIRELAGYQRKNIGYNLYSDNTTYLTRYNGMTPLHIAVEEGNADIVKTLLDCTEEPDVASSDHETPLHLAVSRQHTEIVNLLLAANAALDKKNKDGDTALHLAVRSSNHDIIKILVDAGADILTPNLAGDTALHIAMYKNTDMASACFESLKPNKLTGFNLTNRDGHTPFTIAAAKNHLDIINYCLMPQQDNDNTEDDKIQQKFINLGLKSAARTGHIDAVNAILPCITDINAECSENKGSTLSIAAHYKHAGIVKALCKALLNDYIAKRDSEPDYKKYTYFFVKKGAGYSKEQKLGAARALLSVLNGEAEKGTLDKFHGPLHNKTLHGIFNIINKYVFGNYQPPASQAEIAELKRPSNGSSYSYASRSRGEFAYLNDIGHAAETAACICSCVTNSGRGYGNSGCSVM